jgi:NitT/TauT family transport system substrate-binding protein
MRRARLLFPVAVGVLALLASACSSSGASNTPSGSGPEKTHIVVGTLPIGDAAPLYMAIKRGFFKQEGLTVTPETIQTSADAVPKLLGGSMDFTLLNYVTGFAIQEQNPAVKFRIVADSSQAAPGGLVILIPKNSKIKSPADLKGKKIASPATVGIPILAIASTLKSYGVKLDPKDIVTMPFPNMEAALAHGQVDAAWVTEPFITIIESAIGARVLTDTTSGPMANFPIAGWGTIQSYVQRYPKTVAAFQRAMGKAQTIAASDRKAVEQILPTYTAIKPQVAQVMTMNTYPTTLSAIRLQRVVNLMLQLGILKKQLDVAPMLVAPPRS